MVAVCSICMLVAFAYWNSILDGFAFDDNLIIEDNPLIRHVRYLPTLFTTHYWEGAAIGGFEYSQALYRPLVVTTYMLNYLAAGLTAWPFHLTNILFHLGVVLTLYGVACRLGLGWPGALATALVFAVHPLNTEAVTGIVGRAELMMTLGVLLAFYWDLAKNPVQNVATKLSFASLCAFALGMLSKEQAVMLPALLIVADGMRGNGVARPRWWRIFWNARLRYLGYLMVSVLYVVARTAAIGTRMPPRTGIENPLSTLDAASSLINAVKVDGLYLWLTAWPANLSADYSYNAIPLALSALDPSVWISALVWISLLALGIIGFFGRRRALAIGVTIAVLFFLPAANLIVYIGTIMGERLFYLPLAGLCLMLGAAWDSGFMILLHEAPQRWRVTFGVGAAILVLTPLTMRTVARNEDWKSNETLFASIIRARPNNAKARLIMAGIYQERGELGKALEEHQAALAIAPQYKDLGSFAASYGDLLTELGRPEEAVAVINAALQKSSAARKNPAIYRTLSKAHEQNHSPAMAVAARKRAIQIAQRVPRTSPRALETDYNQLARLLTLRGKMAEGRDALAKALELVQKDQDLLEATRTGLTAEILGNMALIDTLDGRYTRAEETYLRVLDLLDSPLLEDKATTRVARLRDYASLLRKMGREQDAAAIDEKAAALGTVASGR